MTDRDARGRDDELVDQASMDSFPASDPPPFWARDVPPAAGDEVAAAITETDAEGG